MVEFGPLEQAGKTLSLKETIHLYLQQVDRERCDEVYQHDQCCKDCKGRGCGRLYVADGNWKLHYPICMFTMPSAVKGLEEFVPSVCTQEPAMGKAFCAQHSSLLERASIPTDLRSFIRYCGANPDNYSKEEKKKVEAKLQEICERSDEDQDNFSVPDIQGTSSLYENLGMKVKYINSMKQDLGLQCQTSIRLKFVVK